MLKATLAILFAVMATTALAAELTDEEKAMAAIYESVESYRATKGACLCRWNLAADEKYCALGMKKMKQEQ
jgi:hypothetical protein